MLLTFYLLFIGLHVSEGCTLENRGRALFITARTGESVLLPCYCTDHVPPDAFIWETENTDSNKWEEVSSESGQYRDRVQLFNGHSPGNLSLLMSHLTEEDGGLYRCEVKGSGYTDISLTVEGCNLEKTDITQYITARAGGSVLLSCYCTDLHTKPETFTWKKLNTNIKMYEVISSGSGQYRNRVQLVNGHSPGNLSLLISHLTEEDGGFYLCELTENKRTYIKLTFEEGSLKTTPSTAVTSSFHMTTTPPQSLPFVPFALVTVIFLHIIVAVVYHTKRNKAQADPAGVHYSTADGDGDRVVSLE
ncbi:junctional adhesion molecule-like [Pygocentrus nattereri]|uniref:junctional adhesion molecule-like n=1 Tax=Pygocentrus nattereri TaxID=42514 RepID=UPI001891D483|nr:junctional adhesion molecule-like [Pygocentrus nattereri]